MKRVTLLATTLLLCFTARAQVVGGQSIQANADFFCSLVYTQTPTIMPACGATLIHPQWVLTAGHCGLNPANLQELDSIDVVIAPYLRHNTNAYQRIRSEKIVIHPDFQFVNGLVHDIALIKLKQPVPQATILDMPMQGDDSHNNAGTVAYVAGYGIYDTATLQNRADTLQMAEIEIIANTVCNAPPMFNGRIQHTMLCAGKLNTKATGGAAGDSGGPLFVSGPNGMMQVGIVSFGNGPYSNGTIPGAYTKISAYRGWIDSVINGLIVSVEDKAQNVPRITVNGDEVKLQFGEPLKYQLKYAVLSIDGKTIQTGNINAQATATTIQITDVPSGLYYIKMTDGKYTNHTERLPLFR